jgi:HD superfamily phosphodiesterase
MHSPPNSPASHESTDDLILIYEHISKYDLGVDVDRAITFCESMTSDHDESHDLQHHIEVVCNALEICEKCDMDVLANIDDIDPADISNQIDVLVFYSAIFHDTVDDKYSLKDPTKPQRLKRYLMDNMEYKVALDVLWIIDHISYRKEKLDGYPKHPDPLVQIARDIVSDADRIEACRIKRAVDFAHASHPEYTQWELYKEVTTHCYEKLLHLPLSMRTSPGEEICRQRIQCIQKYVDAFNALNDMAFDPLILSTVDKQSLRDSYGNQKVFV